MPCASQCALPALPAPSTLTGMIVAPGAKPRIAPWAAMIPAMCVPWPLSSAGVPSPLTKSAPWTSSTTPSPSSSRPLPAISRVLVQMRPRSSARLSCTPVSITATIAPLPVDCCQALGARREAPAASGHCAIREAAEAGAPCTARATTTAARTRRTIPIGIGHLDGPPHNRFWVFRPQALLEHDGPVGPDRAEADGDAGAVVPVAAMGSREQLPAGVREPRPQRVVAALGDGARRLVQPLG